MKKVLLIAGIVVIIVVIIAVILIHTNKDKITNLAIDKGFNAMEMAVLRDCPRSISPDSVQVIFDKAIARIKSGDANKQQMQEIMTSFRTGLRDKQLDSLEVISLLEELKILGEE